MSTGEGPDNASKPINYRARRLLAVVIAVAVVLMFLVPASREYIKSLVLPGMPALVIWSYRRRFIKYTWTWWVSTLLILGLVIGSGFMLYGARERLATRAIEKEAAVYLLDGKYDQAIAKYRELELYGREARMNKKIREVKVQKGYDASYREARRLALEGKTAEAKNILKKIPLEAIVYKDARRFLNDLEKD